MRMTSRDEFEEMTIEADNAGTRCRFCGRAFEQGDEVIVTARHDKYFCGGQCVDNLSEMLYERELEYRSSTY